MALIPMEERLASKEKAWEAERRDLTAKWTDISRNLKVAEERSQDLDKKTSQMEEERCGRHGDCFVFYRAYVLCVLSRASSSILDLHSPNTLTKKLCTCVQDVCA